MRMGELGGEKKLRIRKVVSIDEFRVSEAFMSRSYQEKEVR